MLLTDGDPDALFAQAGARAAVGAYDEAEAIYQHLLQSFPKHPVILAALGNAQFGGGKTSQAIASYREALAIPHPQPDVWCNLARALRSLGQNGEALTAIDRSLLLDSSLFAAWMCRGNILWDMERVGEAITAYGKAAQLNPNDPRVHFNLANALRKTKRMKEAVAAYTQAILLAPDYAEARLNLALVLLEAGNAAEALEAVDQALPYMPSDYRVHDTKGQILHALGRFEEALSELSRAIALRPNSAVAYSNRGVSFHAAGRFDEALADFEKAISLDGKYADAIVNRGTLLKDLGRFEEAEEAYKNAVAAVPDHAEANWNLGLLALLRGDYEFGWKNYEWRWRGKVQRGTYIQSNAPQWMGEDLAGKTILIWPEQGYGDFLQFCRYVPMLTARGAKVILEAPSRLQSLMVRLDGSPIVMGPEARQQKIDFQCPIMSLPLAFKTTLQNVPGSSPYLSASSERVEHFEELLGPKTALRVGLVWSASLDYIYGRERHMRPQNLEALFDLPVSFHIIQKDFNEADRLWLSQHPELPCHADAQGDFHDAAALISALDVVVTVDTSVAHLAGALGKPVFVMLPHVADWRWLADTEVTPWYSTMRLIRQSVRGEWSGPISAVRGLLQEMLQR